MTSELHTGPSPSAVGPDHIGPDHIGPDHTGPDHTGPDHTGPRHDQPQVDVAPWPTETPAVRLRRLLSFRNISALYVFAALFVFFALTVPKTFLATGTWQSLLDTSAITALIAVGLVLPFAAGVFDLAVGAEVGLGAILVAWLLAKQGVPALLAIPLTLIAGATIGLVAGLLVVRARIDSFIATLGLSSVLIALVAWISRSEQILNLPTGFQNLATARPLGVTNAVVITLVVAVLIWYVLERTAVGRRVYATGGAPEAARLAGVRTSRVIITCLVANGVVAAAAGVLVSSQLGVGDPTVGPAYLLPAIAAVFLGSTQFRGGRINVLGALVSVYVLAVGVKGFQLSGAPVWIPDLFNGAALLIAVGAARYQGRTGRVAALRKRYAGPKSTSPHSRAGRPRRQDQAIRRLDES